MIRTLILALALAAPATASDGDDGVQRIEIVGGSYYFEPAHVVVQAGKPVELTLRKAQGVAPHDFSLRAPEAGIDVEVALRGEPRTVSFTPKVAGRFEYRCTKNPPLLRSHHDRGMHGILEVID